MMTTSSETTPEVCRVTLVGPRNAQERPKMMRMGPWTRREWRKLVLEFEVGSHQYPDWGSVNTTLYSVQALIKDHGGRLTDQVVELIQANLKIVAFETFRGP